MRDYSETNPTFNEVIQIPETTDTNHADNINHAPLQIYENTMVLRNALLPDEYVEGESYTAGQYVLKDGVIYRVLEDMDGEWDDSKVQSVSLFSELLGIVGKIEAAQQSANEAKEIANKAVEWAAQNEANISNLSELLQETILVAYEARTSAKMAQESADKAQATADAAISAITEINSIISGVPTQKGHLYYTGSEISPEWNSYNSDALEIGGETTGVNVGTYTATFTPKEGYKWTDGSTDTISATWTIEKAIVSNLPSQVGTLTYNGEEQSPEWSDFEASITTMSGDLSGINAGTYTVNLSLNDPNNYSWYDDTVEDKTVTWRIAYAIVEKVPSPEGIVEYRHTSVSPEWTDYDENELAIGGDASATDRGTYEVTFTPRDNYVWYDGLFTEKTVTWEIGKGYPSKSYDFCPVLSTSGVTDFYYDDDYPNERFVYGPDSTSILYELFRYSKTSNNTEIYKATSIRSNCDGYKDFKLDIALSNMYFGIVPLVTSARNDSDDKTLTIRVSETNNYYQEDISFLYRLVD